MINRLSDYVFCKIKALAEIAKFWLQNQKLGLSLAFYSISNCHFETAIKLFLN